MCLPDSFVCIDFETANKNRVSACCLGFVKVINGEIVDKKNILIKPVGEFSKTNIFIHHITPLMTENAKTFDLIFPELKEDLESFPVFSYSKFDKSVLESLIRYYNIKMDKGYAYFDVLDFTREALVFSNLESYTLPAVHAFCGLGEFSHHNAVQDASACAKVYLTIKNQIIKVKRDHPPRESWFKQFADIVENVISDNVITTDEAWILKSMMSGEHGIFIEGMLLILDEILLDGQVDLPESEALIGLLKLYLVKYNAGDFKQHEDVEKHIVPIEAVESFTTNEFIDMDEVLIEVPDTYQPVLREIPSHYKDRWEFVRHNPFTTIAGANVVITGDCCKINRLKAEKLVTKLGGILKSSVSRLTDILVVLEDTDGQFISTKVVKAREQQENGSPIKILNADGFIELVNNSLNNRTEDEGTVQKATR